MVPRWVTLPDAPTPGLICSGWWSDTLAASASVFTVLLVIVTVLACTSQLRDSTTVDAWLVGNLTREALEPRRTITWPKASSMVARLQGLTRLLLYWICGTVDALVLNRY